MRAAAALALAALMLVAVTPGVAGGPSSVVAVRSPSFVAGGLQPPGREQTPLDTARADLQRRRDALVREYNLETQRPRLDAYARTAVVALRDPAIARQEPIGRLPFVAGTRREFLERTAAFVADRLGVRLSSFTVKFSRLPKGTAGRVRLVGNGASVAVADRHRDDDEEIFAIVAHEFAHIVLETPGSGVTEAGADDEDLADATVVMAGVGPLLLRASYREGISVSGNKAEWNVRRTGSLNPVAIAYLTLVQAELADLGEEARRSLIGDWLEPAWSVREEARRQKPAASGQKQAFPQPLAPGPQHLVQ
jgi:hypothetical protein